MPLKLSAQEARLERAMASFQAQMLQLQEQGLDMSQLHASASEIAAIQQEQVQIAQMAQEQRLGESCGKANKKSCET